MEFTAGKIPLFESALNEPAVNVLEFLEDDYSKPATGIPPKKIDYYSAIMRHKDALYNRVTLHSYTQVRVKEMTKISCLIHTILKNALWKGCPVRPTSGIHEMAENKLMKNLLAIFIAAQKKFPEGMVICYATRNLVIHSTIMSAMATGTCESLNLLLNQATAVSIGLLRSKLTDLCLVASDETITNSTATNQDSFHSRPVRTKHRPAPRQ